MLATSSGRGARRSSRRGPSLVHRMPWTPNVQNRISPDLAEVHAEVDRATWTGSGPDLRGRSRTGEDRHGHVLRKP